MAIPEQPFGFVAGRWVLSLADTPMDSDRAPDYKPLYPGSVIFNNKLSHRVVTDGSETVGIVKTRYEAQLNEDGRVIDAEEHEFVALPVGVYSVTFSFGQYAWPNFDIEVKAEHTLESPLWLPSKSPVPAGPGVVHVVSEEARLAAEAAAASAWAAVDTPGRQGPRGPEGPPGDLDAEHLAGAPRLTNLVHDRTWGTSGATIHSQTDRTVTFTATSGTGYVNGPYLTAGVSYYFTAEVKATSDRVVIGTTPSPVYHSGSGDWERLAGRVTPSGNAWFVVRDFRSSGWDQVEVRDPVLIDLTAAFGAGREPTREYMDALLAKHDNYIGVVEPFVVGDAFQEQTVVGPGMTVRHDTSVGTRVLLDHPGGTTMLYGGTGWRNISELLDNSDFELHSSGGFLRLSRTNTEAHIHGRLRVKEGASIVGTERRLRGLVFVLPEGVTPYSANIPTPSVARIGVYNTGLVFTIGQRVELMGASGNWVAGEEVLLSATVALTNAWPTTPFGTPS